MMKIQDPLSEKNNSTLRDDQVADHISHPNTMSKDTIWQCHGNNGMGEYTNPFNAFLGLLRSNALECCLPKRNQTNHDDDDNTTRTLNNDLELYDEAATTSDNTDMNESVANQTNSINVDVLRKKESSLQAPLLSPTTSDVVTTSNTDKWMSTNQYTIDVWNAIITVLCLNAFVQFFTGNKKK